MKPANSSSTTWQRFCEDDRSTLHSRWGLLAIVMWAAVQSLWL